MLVNQWSNVGSLCLGRGRTVVVATVGGGSVVVVANVTGTVDSVVVPISKFSGLIFNTRASTSIIDPTNYTNSVIYLEPNRTEVLKEIIYHSSQSSWQGPVLFYTSNYDPALPPKTKSMVQD